MTKNIIIKKRIYTGKTSPVPLDLEKLGLTKYDLKIINYAPMKIVGQPQAFKRIERKKFLDTYRNLGIVIPLYKGKSQKVSTLNKDYKKMDFCGILFMSNDSFMENFVPWECTNSLRSQRLKAEQAMHRFLHGVPSKPSTGILYYLNRKEWTVEIRKSNGKLVFKDTGLKKHVASELLTKKLEEINNSISYRIAIRSEK